ncbi:LexA family transcriptional regulator [Rouxiella badensis]|uniref:LexA family protein n=1 Tax=Rouxiella badensis TaxID=1646377 RepID=UPI001D13494D|nr:LexA family transcriptional regulator [Rouxiella badensis]MCC3740251.1 LexA family transcriptional regulator [Rouxiella badensis]
MKEDNNSEIYECRRLKLKELVGRFETQRAFSEATGIDVTVVSRMLYPEGKSGKRNIGEKAVRQIEDALKLSRGWMDGISAESSNVSFAGFNETAGVYPVISWVSAGAWSEAIEPYHRKSIDRWLETTVECSENSFWLDVKGDSMTAPAGLSIPEGMVILVDPEVEATNGKLVVAKLESDNEATFKKYVVDAGRKFLKALNPQWPMTEINGNCKIIGVVVDAKIANLP